MPISLPKFVPPQNFEIDFSNNPLLLAASIIFLLFLLVVTLAQMRRHFIDWSIKGAVFGIFFGFLLALILEGFLILGGRTAFTEILGWKDAPRPLLTILDAGRAKAINVLGITDEIPNSFARTNPTAEEAIEIFQSLDPSETKKAKSLICKP